MLNRLGHLWPQFSALQSGETAGVSAAFWLAMVLMFAAAILYLVWHQVKFSARRRALRQLLAELDHDTLAHSRLDTRARAVRLSTDNVGDLWREFDESLVASEDRQQLFNTLDAEHFFNARTLAPELTGSRLLAAAPSFLVAVGVLGTFVGLTIGLSGLDLGQNAKVDELRDGISTLIDSAAVAFMTSVWGVFFSLLLNFIEKVFERRTLAQIQSLQNQIDFLYPRIAAEQSLLQIADHSRSALQELHERIGDRLQEAMSGMNEAMQQALADTLNNILEPAIQTLVSNANQQSTEVLESLIEKFMAGMSSTGRAQGDLMKEATEGVNRAVNALSSEMTGLFKSLEQQQRAHAEAAEAQNQVLQQRAAAVADDAQRRQEETQGRFSELMGNLGEHLKGQLETAERRDIARQAMLESTLASASESQQKLVDDVSRSVLATQEQTRQIAAQHQELLKHLQASAEAAAASSKHMDSSANQLGLLSTNVQQAANMLGEQLGAVTEKIEVISERNAEVADQLQTQNDAIARVQEGLQSCIETLEQTVTFANDGFDKLRIHQENYLKSVSEQFQNLAEVLRNNVGAIEEQAASWLREYADLVRSQVNERLDEWNKQTSNFSTQMIGAVNAIGDVLDELERR